MKQTNSLPKEMPVSENKTNRENKTGTKNKTEHTIQTLSKLEQNSKPSWAVYYLLAAMIVGMIIILLKVLGAF